MLKRTIASLLLFILCGAFCSAQNIDESIFDKYVDYVNCKYMSIYIEKNYSKDKDTAYIQKIKKGLNKISISNSLSYEKLSELLRYDSEIERARIINSIKSVSPKTIDIFLEECKKQNFTILDANFILDLERELNKISPEMHGNVQQEEESTDIWLWLIISFVIGFVVGWQRKWLFSLFKKNNKKLTSVEQSLREDFDEVKEENKNLSAKIKDLEMRNKKLEQENIEIRKKIDNNQYAVNSTSSVTSPKGKSIAPETDNSIGTPISTLYFDAIIDGFFNKERETPNEDTIFELHLQTGQAATFKIYPAAYNRVIANPSFLDGCDKQVLSNAQNVKIESPGIAQKQPDGKWRITKKLNVIIN